MLLTFCIIEKLLRSTILQRLFFFFSKSNPYNHKQERGKIDTKRYKWRLSVKLYRRWWADGRDLQ